MNTLATLFNFLAVFTIAFLSPLSLHGAIVVRSVTIPPAGPSYLVSEDCEGVGTPTGWVDSSGSGVLWDQSALALAGSETLHLNFSTPNTYFALPSSYPEIWVYAIVRASASDGSVRDFIELYGGGTKQAYVATYNTGFRAAHGATTGDYGGGIFPANTTKHLWLHYDESGALEVYLSDSATIPGSPSLSRTGTGGNIDQLRLRTENMSSYFDNILVSTTAIGSDPFP